MTNLIIKKESGAEFTFSRVDSDVLNVSAIGANGSKFEYSMKFNNIAAAHCNIEIGGSIRQVPFTKSQIKEIKNLAKNRKEFSFDKPSQLNEFISNNNCGESFNEDGKFKVYKYL